MRMIRFNWSEPSIGGISFLLHCTIWTVPIKQIKSKERRDLTSVIELGSLWPVKHLSGLFYLNALPISRCDRYRFRHLYLSFPNIRCLLSNKIPEMFLKFMCSINFRKGYWNGSYSCSRNSSDSRRDDYVFPPCPSAQNYIMTLILGATYHNLN